MSAIAHPGLATPAPSTALLERIALLLACAFAAELVLGGPGFWSIGGVSVRKLLFIANMGAFCSLWLLGRIRLTAGALGVALGLLVVMVVWIVLLPAVGGARQFKLALQDGLPLATGLYGVLLLSFFRQHPQLWPALQRTAAISLVLVALMNLALWGVGMSGDEGSLAAQAFALYWFTWGQIDLQPPLYLGQMPDGFFRAMWITGVLYVPALLYCIARRQAAGIALFGLALVATYTRALWLTALFGIVIAQALSTPKARFIDMRLAVTALLLGGLGLIAWLFGAQGGDDLGLGAVLSERIGSTFSDSSAGERFEQVGPLLDAWARAPWFGNGFGAQAALIRSEEAPFSYELTVLALLMKVGVVGLAVLLLLTGGCWLAAWLAARPRQRRDCAGLAAVVSFLLAASTNPFLLNFVGMSLLCFLLAKPHVDHIAPVP